MKGLILSGGAGTRLRPLTHTRAKQLIPLANKPVIFYGIEALLEANVYDIGIVVGDTAAAIQEAVGDGSRWGSSVHITYIPQAAPLGLADAVRISRPFLDNDRFIMLLGDNFIEQSLSVVAGEFGSPSYGSDCLLMLKEVEDYTQFGIAELEPETVLVASGATGVRHVATKRRVLRLREKPTFSVSKLAVTGIYFFDPVIFEAIAHIQPSARGELEITDAIQWLIDQDYCVDSYQIHGYWADTGKTETMLAANTHILSQVASSIAPTAVVQSSSQLYGSVILEDGVEIINSVIRGPVIIGSHSRIENAYIGPFTSIAHNVVVKASEIDSSIILEYSEILSVQGRIAESLIGHHTLVYTPHMKPQSHRLTLGGHSKVGVQSFAL